MRRIFTLTFILIFICSNTFSQSWHELDSGSEEGLTGIFFINPEVGYCCGANGTILKTTNGGMNWDALNSGTTLPLGYVHFINADTGFVSGGEWNGQGIVLRTTDGGLTWSTSATCDNLITSVAFINSSEGVYTGGYGCGTGVARTTDTGETWSSVSNPSSHIWNREVFFVNDDIGYIVGSYEKFIKTSDGGKTWTGSIDMSKGMYRGVWFTSVDTGYVTGAAGVKKTTDGGSTWDIVLPDINGSKVKFASSNVGFALDNVDLHKTIDAGDTWSIEETGITDPVLSVFFLDEDFGYACGGNGAILKWTYGCPEPYFDTIPVYDTTFVTIQDTTFVTVIDTATTYEYISVTDTLIIDAVLTGLAAPDNRNTIKVYPNPAKDHIFINTGDYARMNNYQLKIINQLGAIVFETNVEGQLYEVNLSTWTGMGSYFVQVIDSEGVTIDVRKIILQ